MPGPFAEAARLLRTIPGVGASAAATIVAEIGTDMGRFPSAKHLASWAGVCPGNRQSAGKRRGGKPTGGDTWLKAALGEVAWAAARTKGSYLHAQFHIAACVLTSAATAVSCPKHSASRHQPTQGTRQ